MVERDTAEVLGDKGQAILLVAGGASTSHHFFPSIETIPDVRIVAFDRPGTGCAIGAGQASCASGSAAFAEVLKETGCFPALVVAQSLGGPVAIQFALDHPDLVSGLVLIDPTPFNRSATIRQVRLLFGLLGAPGRLPRIGPKFDRAVWKLLGAQRLEITDELGRQAARTMVESASLADTSAAVRSLEHEGPALAARLTDLGKPVVIMTADRKEGDPTRAAHYEIAHRLGGRVVTWPGAIHAEHVRQPQRIRELVESVLADL